MSQRVLSIITITIAGLLVISLGLLTLFGVQLSRASKVKATEISSNLAAQEKKLKADFQSEKEKTLATYTASDVFGSFSFSYPKVWSTYVKQDTATTDQLTFLGDPSLIVFDKQSEIGGPYSALRVQVFGNKYENQVSDTESKYIRGAKKPYTESSVTVSGISGKKFVGVHEESKLQYSFILLPLRDKTLYMGTDDSAKYSQNLETILKTFKIYK